MVQLKISAAFLIVVLALMGFAYFALSANVSSSILGGEANELSLARRAVLDAEYAAEAALLEQVAPLAEDQLLRSELGRLQRLVLEEGSIDPVRQQSSRQKTFDHLLEWRNATTRELGDKAFKSNLVGSTKVHAGTLQRSLADWWGSKPDLVLAFVATPLKNTTGHVLVAYAERGQELQGGLNYAESLAVLKRTEESKTSAIDVVIWNDFEYLVAATPLYDAEGGQLGTVVVGFQLGSGLVERLAAVLGGDTTLLVYSFYRGERLYTLDNAIVKDALFSGTYHPVELSEGSGVVDKSEKVAFGDLAAEQTYLGVVDGEKLLIQRYDWIAVDGDPRFGFVVVGHYGQASAPVDDLKFQIPLVGVIILLTALIATLFIMRSFLRPLEDIDVGIQEILAGNREYAFRARPRNALHSELANSLNQLTAFLQGKTGAEEESEAWDRLMVDLEPERPSVYGMQAVKLVPDDGELAKLQLLYDDYMVKRQQLNQHVDMDFDRFCRRIKRNEAALKEKHNCVAIEFSVAIIDEKVVLKPTPIFT